MARRVNDLRSSPEGLILSVDNLIQRLHVAIQGGSLRRRRALRSSLSCRL